MREIDYVIAHGNATSYAGDVLVLKYARGLYGASAVVANALVGAGAHLDQMKPDEGAYSLLSSRSVVLASQVLFMGTTELNALMYTEIRAFTRDALLAVGHAAPQAGEIVMTLHGVGYGLDEVESCLSQFDGCVDAILAPPTGGKMPHVRRITVVDLDPARVARLQAALLKHVVAADARVRGQQRSPGVFTLQVPDSPTPVQRTTPAGTPEASRHKAMVAMPFSTVEMQDYFHYAIQNAVRDAGLICERIDHVAFTGDIMQELLDRLATASVVVAVLTGRNPNVYLEVGYAWGKGRPTILLAKAGEDLAFDVRGQRRLDYTSMRDLEEKLKAELRALQEAGRI